MARVYVNEWIYDQISAQLSEVKVKVVPVSGLSRRDQELQQARPLLAYLFVRSQQPCVAWGGTSGSFEADRLIGQRKERARYDSVAYLQLPDNIRYDSVFARMVEQTTLDLVETMWPWCFLENKVRSCYQRNGWDDLALSLAMPLIEKLAPLFPDEIRCRDRNPMFDLSTHRVVDEDGTWIGKLVAKDQSVTIQRDSEIRMATGFDWHPKSKPGPYIKMSTEYNRLLDHGILRVREWARHRHPLVVRFPHTVRSFAAALQFLKGSSKARLSIVEMATGVSIPA